MVQLRENALPILESYGVDLVLNGHSHVYERSYLLNGHYGYSWDFGETNKVDPGDGREDGDGAYHKHDNRGTVYVVAGTGASPAEWNNGQHPAHYTNFVGQLGSCLLDINSNRLDFKFIGADTNILDHFTIIKAQPLPAPKITSVHYAPNALTLTWDSVTGKNYQVYWQATLIDTPVVISEQIQAFEASTFWATDLDPADDTGFFFVAALPE
jgi:hypothetical protein